MITQYQIEQAAGIDNRIAKHMMEEKTAAARVAMSALKLCMSRFEQCAFGILKAAVADCKKEISEIKS